MVRRIFAFQRERTYTLNLLFHCYADDVPIPLTLKTDGKDSFQLLSTDICLISIFSVLLKMNRDCCVWSPRLTYSLRCRSWHFRVSHSTVLQEFGCNFWQWFGRSVQLLRAVSSSLECWLKWSQFCHAKIHPSIYYDSFGLLSLSLRGIRPIFSLSVTVVPECSWSAPEGLGTPDVNKHEANKRG